MKKETIETIKLVTLLFSLASFISGVIAYFNHNDVVMYSSIGALIVFAVIHEIVNTTPCNNCEDLYDEYQNDYNMDDENEVGIYYSSMTEGSIVKVPKNYRDVLKRLGYDPEYFEYLDEIVDELLMVVYSPVKNGYCYNDTTIVTTAHEHDYDIPLRLLRWSTKDERSSLSASQLRLSYECK
jgi:hypothetical protein